MHVVTIKWNNHFYDNIKKNLNEAEYEGDDPVYDSQDTDPLRYALNMWMNSRDIK